MANKRCGHKGRISRLIKTGMIKCCKKDRQVEIIVAPEGNQCTDLKCPYSKVLIPQILN